MCFRIPLLSLRLISIGLSCCRQLNCIINRVLVLNLIVGIGICFFCGGCGSDSKLGWLELLSLQDQVILLVLIRSMWFSRLLAFFIKFSSDYDVSWDFWPSRLILLLLLPLLFLEYRAYLFNSFNLVSCRVQSAGVQAVMTDSTATSAVWGAVV